MLGTIQKIAIQAVVVLALVATIFFQFKKISTLTTQYSQVVLNNKSLVQGVNQYKDKYGVLHTESIQQINTIAAIKQSKDSVTKALIDSANKYKIALKNITSLGRVDTKFVTETKVKFVYRDTSYNLSKLPDLYHTIEINDGELSDSLVIKNTLTLISHTHKETIAPRSPIFFIRWFQKKQTITDVNVVNSNPFIKTTDQWFTIVTP